MKTNRRKFLAGLFALPAAAKANSEPKPQLPDAKWCNDVRKSIELLNDQSPAWEKFEQRMLRDIAGTFRVHMAPLNQFTKK